MHTNSPVTALQLFPCILVSTMSFAVTSPKKLSARSLSRIYIHVYTYYSSESFSESLSYEGITFCRACYKNGGSSLVWNSFVSYIINVVALFSNFLTCYAVYRNKRLRTLPNMFVLALGVSDILMSTCSMHFSVATLFHGQWLFGERFCRFHGFGSLTFGLV